MKQINRLNRNRDSFAETGTNPKYIDISVYGNCVGIKVKHEFVFGLKWHARWTMLMTICNGFFDFRKTRLAGFCLAVSWPHLNRGSNFAVHPAICLPENFAK